MVTSRVQTSRRTAISVALAAPLALGACRLDPPPVSDPTTATAPVSSPSPDAEVVAAARKGIALVVASIERASDTYPRLAPALRPWLALHAAHLEVLDDGTPVSAVGGEVPDARPDTARRRLLDQEANLSEMLADAARRATSGDLARVLASMSAAVRQRLVT